MDGLSFLFKLARENQIIQIGLWRLSNGEPVYQIRMPNGQFIGTEHELRQMMTLEVLQASLEARRLAEAI